MNTASRALVRRVISWCVAVTAVAWAVPALVGSAWLATFTSCAIFAMTAAGLGLLYGRLGLASLTQVAFVGVGSWVALRVGFAFELPFPLLVVASGLAAGALGFVLSLPALRLRGLYLALVTLMVAGGFDVVFNATGFPNGGGGFLGYQASGELRRLPRPSFARDDVAYFRFVVIISALILVIVGLQMRSRIGRAWAIIAQSEAAALSSGVNVTLSKAWAFTFAGVLSGIGGALLAGQLGQVGPSSFQASSSILLFSLTLIGGSTKWVGWIAASLLYLAVPTLLNDWGVDGNVALMFFGVALMVNLIGAPSGIAGQLAGLGALIRAKFAPVLASRRTGSTSETSPTA